MDPHELAARYHSIVETAPDGIIVITDEGVIDSVNPAVERLFGYPAEELVGRDITTLMPEPYRSEHGRYMARYLVSGETRVIGAAREVPGRRRDGSTFPLRLSVGEMRIGGRRMFTGIVHDVGRRRSLEDELGRVERKLASLAQEAALRRVATAAAAGTATSRLLDLVAQEVRDLLGVDAGLVLRLDDDAPRVVGVATADGERPPQSPDPGILAHLAGGGRPVVMSVAMLPEGPLSSWARRRGLRVAVAAPVRVAGAVWGTVMAASADRRRVVRGSETLLASFAELAAVAIASAEDRRRLEEMASTDALTGLANHRAFQEALRREFAGGVRRGLPVALALIDVDRFKRVNDRFGHQSGDRVLSGIAGCLRAVAREDDTLARVGGEEFAWLMPGCDADRASIAVDRFREVLSGTRFPDVGTVTVSGGICCRRRAASAGEMFRLADGALYWAKENGRDLVLEYRPDVVKALSAGEHATRLKRHQNLQSLRVIARAVDAKDHSTQEHSERVADTAVALATVLDWPPEHRARLRDAGLVHDVGKIGVPDAILLKPARLTPEERRVVEGHVRLGVEMLTDVLDPEQIAWVRGHHERWDGGGYPDGLAGEAIPEGARILALADAWDVMTSERPYQRARGPAEAIAECERMAGAQFWDRAVAAMSRLVAADALPHGRGAQTPPGG